ncbi:sulfotransferase [Gammaproteobacteria bacterium]|nr:sulfotransferase [Gammaproteobacteria bacterium]
MKINANEILDQAKSETGLSDLGEPLFLEGLNKLIDSINNEANLNEIGIQAQPIRIQGLLSNRLRFEEDLKKFPEILEQEIIAPIVIVGLPRTGSTMTHRLLASDPNHTAMLWWEGRYPALLPGEKRGDIEARMQLGKAEVDAVVAASPEALDIHPWDYKGADEEILLLEHNFLSTVPESFMALPSYSEWIEEQDHALAYEDLKKFIQYLQWQNPGRENKRWVLKSPHHLGFIDKMISVFPDAKIIQTHRDPIKTVPSFCSMCANLFEPLTTNFDKVFIGKHWSNKLTRALNHCMNISEKHPDNFLDLEFLNMIKDPIDEMKKIYDFIGEPFGEKTEVAMEAWREENKHEMGAHKYSLEEYDLTESQINNNFSKYQQKYIN